MKKMYIWIIIAMWFSQVHAQGVLSLDQCVELALQNNIGLKNSQLNVRAAEQVKKSAFTRYFPQVNAGGMMFQTNRKLLDLEMPGGNLPVYDGYPANLASASQFAYFPGFGMSMLEKGTVGYVNAMQPLFTGGRIINGNKLASVGTKASEYQYNLARDKVVLETGEQYWQIVSLNEKAATVASYIELLKNLQKQVQDAYHSGVVMKNDVLKVQLELNRILLGQSKLLNGKKLATMAFCRHLGVELDSVLVLRDPMSVNDSPETFYVDKFAALPTRDEYQLLKLSVRAAKLSTRMKVGEMLPTAGVGVSGMYYKVDDMDDDNFTMAYGMVSIPISGLWSGCHQVEEKKAKEHIAENDFNDNTQLLLLQMEKAWQDFSDAYKQYQLSLSAREQAVENLKVNQDSYDNGLVTVSDLLEARALLQEAENELTDAKAHYLTSKTRYLQVTGR